MKTINVSQSSTEWLEWRQSRITATDASIITGSNPFKSIKQLYEQKLLISPPQPVNSRMLRGQELEPIARDLFIKKTGIQVSPVVIEHDIDYWHGSSLDGIDSTGKIIVEIKCPKWDTHRLALEDSDILFYYQHQMQHQFYTSQASLAYYVSYFPDATNPEERIVILEYLPDFEFIDNLVRLEKRFYTQHLCLFNAPSNDWNAVAC